jgi:hypothetical protein
MVNHMIHTRLTKILATSFMALQVVACGGGSSGGSGNTLTTTSSGAVSEQIIIEEPVSSPVEEAPAADTGSMSMSWTAPATRADGSPMSLADIDGYHIYYGDSAGSYPSRVDITDGSVVTATVNNIPSGTYYLVMSTYDVDGRESTYSSEISKTAQ